ncbi:hypothetical protein AGMMS50289_21730 [Betaproteobacteria bacterium]|nr:hypothetical protein AGMMS50289_21730 [Betaproteobacteria bacterium]
MNSETNSDGGRSVGTTALPSMSMLTSVETDPENNCSHTLVVHDTVLQEAFEYRSADFQSMTWRDCRIQKHILIRKMSAGNCIRHSVLLERVRGGAFSLSDFPVSEDFTVRDSQFLGAYQEKSFEAASDTAKRTLFERTRFGRHAADIVNASARSEIALSQGTQMHNQNLTLSECQVPYLKADWVRTQEFCIEHSSSAIMVDLRYGHIGLLKIVAAQLRTLDLRCARIDRLEIVESDIELLDRSGAQIGSMDLQRSEEHGIHSIIG